jgi:hypothetical protein
VSIRGRILKSDTVGGDGIGARITKNGVTIWGPESVSYNDQTGVEANLDHLSVAAGDVIRFVVDNGGRGNNDHDLTSWDPSVAYIPAGPPVGTATPVPTTATPTPVPTNATPTPVPTSATPSASGRRLQP